MAIEWCKNRLDRIMCTPVDLLSGAQDMLDNNSIDNNATATATIARNVVKLKCSNSMAQFELVSDEGDNDSDDDGDCNNNGLTTTASKGGVDARPAS